MGDDRPADRLYVRGRRAADRSAPPAHRHETGGRRLDGAPARGRQRPRRVAVVPPARRRGRRPPGVALPHRHEGARVASDDSAARERGAGAEPAGGRPRLDPRVRAARHEPGLQADGVPGRAQRDRGRAHRRCHLRRTRLGRAGRRAGRGDRRDRPLLLAPRQALRAVVRGGAPGTGGRAVATRDERLDRDRRGDRQAGPRQRRDHPRDGRVASGRHDLRPHRLRWADCARHPPLHRRRDHARTWKRDRPWRVRAGRPTAPGDHDPDVALRHRRRWHDPPVEPIVPRAVGGTGELRRSLGQSAHRSSHGPDGAGAQRRLRAGCHAPAPAARRGRYRGSRGHPRRRARAHAVARHGRCVSRSAGRPVRADGRLPPAGELAAPSPRPPAAAGDRAPPGGDAADVRRGRVPRRTRAREPLARLGGRRRGHLRDPACSRLRRGPAPRGASRRARPQHRVRQRRSTRSSSRRST